MKTREDILIASRSRAIQEAVFYVSNQSVTLQDVANKFGVTKATVSNDFKQFLPLVGTKELQKKVARKINSNKKLFHKLGGISRNVNRNSQTKGN